MGSSKTLAPTGTVAFSGGTAGAISGTVSYATVTDANGNLDLQAKITFNPTVNDSFVAAYSGDANYPLSQGSSGNVTVTGSDFALFATASSVTVIRGGQGGEQLQIGGQSNYTGPSILPLLPVPACHVKVAAPLVHPQLPERVRPLQQSVLWRRMRP